MKRITYEPGGLVDRYLVEHGGAILNYRTRYNGFVERGPGGPSWGHYVRMTADDTGNRPLYELEISPSEIILSQKSFRALISMEFPTPDIFGMEYFTEDFLWNCWAAISDYEVDPMNHIEVAVMAKLITGAEAW